VAHYRVEPDAGSVRGSLSRDYPPILRVIPGDNVTVRTLDARWNLEPHAGPGVAVRVLEHKEYGHCLCGPIFVEGAEPGMILAIHLRSLVPAPWGWSEAGREPTVTNRRLGLAGGEPASLLWQIDWNRNAATDQDGRRVDVSPFLGVITLAPDEPGMHSTIPPRICGGNIDCKELVAGSTLYLPVLCSGGLLSVGDGHAAQGDGELSETAIECGMTTELEIDVMGPDQVPAPCALIPKGRITLGFHPDLKEAMFYAADAMLRWLEKLLKVDRSTALALSSLAVDLRVTQVVNEVCGVHAILSDHALRNLGYQQPDLNGAAEGSLPAQP
jgi:acetamidase/formamidase